MNSEEFFADDDRYDRQEDHAGHVASKILVSHVVKVVACWLLVTLVMLSVAVGLRVVAVLALWHLSRGPGVGVVVLLVVDVAWSAWGILHRVRELRPLTHEQRKDARTARARARAAQTWRDRMRRGRWWIAKAMSTAYLAIAGAVIADWTTPTLSAVSVAAAVVAMTAGSGLLRRWEPELAPLLNFVSEILHEHEHEHEHEHDQDQDQDQDQDDETH
ncbi:hypothetical protein [Umezawaea sp. Da 62-37]|uniref:hypothetical protein n=1 Tax=Umezawaea sp. Da 62-37 TaxID=3075927 RepID=UPI0028F71532|nr:hypothetical protein [Umezawaea sp. Da 62-37]WNV90257.1 hypothetical protein RM788_18810 [Umezawaea sp. Da 62-37]